MASHLCCKCMMCNAHTLGYPSTADEAWYWLKCILHNCLTSSFGGHSQPRELWFSIYLYILHVHACSIVQVQTKHVKVYMRYIHDYVIETHQTRQGSTTPPTETAHFPLLFKEKWAAPGGIQPHITDQCSVHVRTCLLPALHRHVYSWCISHPKLEERDNLREWNVLFVSHCAATCTCR